MKVLLIGAAHQSKEGYAKQAYGVRLQDGEAGLRQGSLKNLHLLVWELLESGREPRQEVLTQLDKLESWVVLCDEIGCGVVPVDAADRRWRQEVGQLCCALAADADIVERITCGIPQRIKGAGL